MEKKLLPLGIPLVALLWTAQSYPFGWGELPGALLPSRPAEWLLRMAVNLSTRQFKGEDLFERLSRILADTGMGARASWNSPRAF